MARSTGGGRERSDPNLTAAERRRSSLGRATGGDESFLFALYSITRAVKVALGDWPAEQ
ncbi:MAG TPA: hypothetical protein VLE70_05440 [Anaerolineae bacterium]|nr:hypothetical protein [Anaerolineae bacterium]